MDLSMVGIRLASGVVTPLIKHLFRTEGPGAGLVSDPVRLSPYAAFHEKGTLDAADLRTLADKLVAEALRTPGERRLPPGEEAGVATALAGTLYALGDITMGDVQAVRLDPVALARQLRKAAPYLGLSQDAELFYQDLLEVTCLHVLHFFTQRSTFVPSTLVEQSRLLHETVVKLDALLEQLLRRDLEDAEFERTYLADIVRTHSTLTIYGLDLDPAAARWPLDVAYISLEATTPLPRGTEDPRHGTDDPREFPGRFGAAPAEDVLTRIPRALLRGEAGSGKSTLIQWLAVSAARGGQGGRIPFILPLRTVTRHGERLPRLKDFLAAVGSPLAGEQPPGWEGRVMRAERALVLVDGLDEVPEAERARARDWLANLIGAYPGNRWLVTSRPSAVRQDWLADADFEELVLSPMNRTEVADFVERWHEAARTGHAGRDADLNARREQLLDSVRTKPDLARLATNPLLCGLICALHRERRGFLPSGRKELYTAALSMLLHRRDRERRVPLPELAEEPQLQLLQRLAYWLIRNGRTEMDQDRARALIADALPAVPAAARVLGDAPTVFQHFLERTGLLRTPTEDTVEFVHRTFQDFLGARAALDEGGLGELARHAGDDQWADVIRMAVAQGRPREREELIRVLLDQGSERSLLLALASLEYAAELSPALREEVEGQAARLVPPADITHAQLLGRLGPLVLDLLPGPRQAPTEEEAHLAVVAAGAVASDLAIPFLARYCDHPSPVVRETLAQLWRTFDSRQYFSEVIAHLDPPPDRLTVSSEAQLEALDGAAPPVIFATGELSHRALTDCLRRVRLEQLTLFDNRLLTDVEFLRGHDTLKSLSIAQCEAIRDLDGLIGLPLESAMLVVAGSLPLGAVTRSWRHLRRLTLEGSYADWSLHDLDPHVSLRSLRLARATPSLERLVHHRELRSLSLGQAPDKAGWEAIGRLQQLEHLELPAAARLDTPDAVRVPSVRDLVLTSPEPVRVPAYVDWAARHFPRANLG
ncbi:NACHT domain-containing NTPase [Streptomyces sp. ISL-94]|uniref:NACHT domain-containing protein n=1 Tax=Streptomyces sp. ISL-94 TaxID=2819190 RepID=UPI001BE6A09B|nr:NACHT domain-containing protein [Streptomyces sp. ISL-94]MBT2481175.1 NACHT domain-containing protein [Streptomyces sp. ISL-94]